MIHITNAQRTLETTRQSPHSLVQVKHAKIFLYSCKTFNIKVA